MDYQFITVNEFRDWSRLDDFGNDVFLEQLIKSASSIVLAYIKKPALINWDLDKTETMPHQVKLATCMVSAYLHENREGGNPLTSGVLAILNPLRDPVAI